MLNKKSYLIKDYLINNMSIEDIVNKYKIQEKVLLKILAPYIDKKRSVGEYNIYQILKNIFPYYTINEQYYLKDVKLYLDFFIKEIRVGIEYDGVQHDELNPLFHGKDVSSIDKYFKGIDNDNTKEEYLKRNYIYLIRIKSNKEINEENIRRIFNENNEQIKNNLDKYNSKNRTIS